MYVYACVRVCVCGPVVRIFWSSLFSVLISIYKPAKETLGNIRIIGCSVLVKKLDQAAADESSTLVSHLSLLQVKRTTGGCANIQQVVLV